MWYLLETQKKIAIVVTLVVAFALVGCGVWLIATGTEINPSDIVSVIGDEASAEEDDTDTNKVSELVVEDDSQPVLTLAMSEENTTVEVDPQQVTVTGSALQPTVTVTCNGVVLVADKDYILSWENNVNVGTATVTVNGTGAYTGSMNANFEIVEAAQETPEVQTPSEDELAAQIAEQERIQEEARKEAAKKAAAKKKAAKKKSSASKKSSSSSSSSTSRSSSSSSSSSAHSSSSSSSSSSRSSSSSSKKSSSGGMKKQKNSEL